MNLKDYYAAVTYEYFLQMILCIGVFVFVMLPGLQNANILPVKLAVISVLFLFGFFLFRYICFSRRSSGLQDIAVSTKTSPIRLMALPSPRPGELLIIFSPDGVRRMSVIARKAKGRKDSTFTLYEQGFGQSAMVTLDRQTFFCSTAKAAKAFRINRSQASNLSFCLENELYSLSKSTSGKVLKKNGVFAASLQKDLMPVSWQKLYHPNTLQLRLDASLSSEERYICTLFLTLF